MSRTPTPSPTSHCVQLTAQIAAELVALRNPEAEAGSGNSAKASPPRVHAAPPWCYPEYAKHAPSKRAVTQAVDFIGIIGAQEGIELARSAQDFCGTSQA